MEEVPTLEQVLERLKSSPPNPDDAWFTELSKLIFHFPFCVAEHQVLEGPDGFSYFALWLAAAGENGLMGSPAQVMDSVIEHGLGIVFMYATGRPMWELYHGQVLSWKLYGSPKPPRFWNAPPDKTEMETLTQPEQMWMGRPSEQMFPPLVRASLKRVMIERLGIEEPRVGLVQRASEGGISRIVFNLDPNDLGGQEGAIDAYKLLTWYLPYCIPSMYMAFRADSDWMMVL